jgi:hypothetical protein
MLYKLASIHHSGLFLVLFFFLSSLKIGELLFFFLWEIWGGRVHIKCHGIFGKTETF